MTSEPMMPRGRSRFGFFVSSAAVATMSNPMKAKNTTAAPARMPPTPKVLGDEAEDALHERALERSRHRPAGGWAGGTKGE